MEIPLNVQVEYSDGLNWQPIGSSEYVLINPTTEEISHLVVKENFPPKTEVIVPIEWISASDPEKIRLSCSQSELKKRNRLLKRHLLRKKYRKWWLGTVVIPTEWDHII